MDALDEDSDDDGLIDRQGWADGTSPRDSDNDGVFDFRQRDSDGGGVLDGVEVLEHQTDPTFADDDGRGELEEGALVQGMWDAMAQIGELVESHSCCSSALLADALNVVASRDACLLQPATLEVIRPQRFQFGRGRQSTSLRQTRSEHRRHRCDGMHCRPHRYSIGAGHFSGWLRRFSAMSEMSFSSDSDTCSPIARCSVHLMRR